MKIIKFLNNRDSSFKLQFLEKLIPLKFKAGTLIIKKGVRPEEVLFILKGEALSLNTNRIYGSGCMIGEIDIIMKRDRMQSFISKTDLYVLKFERGTFQQILRDYQNIK
jgi:CRP-like cAMP-binding protein